MLSAGQTAQNIHTGQAVQVLEARQVFGITTYIVLDPESGQVYTLGENSLRTETQVEPASKAYVRFLALWARVRAELASGHLFEVSESVLPLPHQRYALERALAGNQVRYLLADEVGLGKTIEAGLIIKELQTRGLIERVLVVCPKGLVSQWEVEMQEKFGERFLVLLPEDYATLKKVSEDQNLFASFGRVISPMDAIKPLEERAGWDEERIAQHNADRVEAVVAGGWDLIIIDEAHHVAGSSSEVARHKLGDALSKASPHLLLLTATPHSGKTEPFLRLMRLLDEDAFPNTLAIVREQVAPYIIRTEKRQAVDNQGKPLFKARHTQLVEITWQARHSLQQQLYQQVTDYVREGYNKAIRERKQYLGFLMILMQRMVSSSTAAIQDTLERRLRVLETEQDQLHTGNYKDLLETESEEALHQALTLYSADIKEEITQLQRLLALARQTSLQGLDAKQEVLVDLLQKLNRKEPGCKIILFTEFVRTQAALVQLLSFQGFTSTIINGQLSIEERNQALEDFRNDKQVLISTDAGGEGLNLQIASIVINFDLPWNPMKIEQRIGRADRIGQTKDVQVFNFILKDTVENRVRQVLEEKLKIILRELGIDKLQDVLDNASADMDFSKVYIDSILRPKFQDLHVDDLMNSINSQVQQAKAVRSIIQEEKQLSPLMDDERRQQSFLALLRAMLQAYGAWMGDEPPRKVARELSVSDPQIKELLEKRQIWHPGHGLPVLCFPSLNVENGILSLWEIALSEDRTDRKTVAFFVNDAGLQRPASARILWEELLKSNSVVEAVETLPLTQEAYNSIQNKAQEMARDAFLTLRADYLQNSEANYRKRQRALTLRIEAAGRIGIDNIRTARIRRFEKELAENQAAYTRKQDICPRFTPMLVARVTSTC